MRQIYKYEIPPLEQFTLTLPKAARILCVHSQRNTPQLWAMVETDNPPEERRFRIIGTGKPIGENEDLRQYLGTFFMDDDDLVLHLFEYR